MSEYISKETAKEIVFDKIINNVVEDQGMYGYLVHLVNEAFDEAPAADVRSTEYCKECRAALLETIDHYKQLCADVRPVVLCRDCKYYYKDEDGYEMCDNSDGYDPVTEDGFCAWAVKMED